jgi:hypothetical protein
MYKVCILGRMRWKDNSICLGSYLGINESAVFENGRHVILISEVEKGLAVSPPGTGRYFWRV